MRRKKLLLALGLVGLLGVGYRVACHSDAETTIPAKEVELVKKNDEAVIHSIPVRAYAPPPIPSLSLIDDDSYRNHINSLNLSLSWLYEEPSIYGLQNNCDEQEIQRRHEEISQRISSQTVECLLWHSTDQLIDLDLKLANCKYREDSTRFNLFLEEIAEHFESTNRSIAAGKVYYFLGFRKKAIDSFFQHERDGVEYLFRIASAEELPSIADYYLQHDDPFNAGKVEWFQGNLEVARTLIEQSERYRKTMEEDILRYLARGWFHSAARTAEELRLPFHRELAQELCQGNEDCLWEFEKYRPFE